jgi:AcrR family transcriptional regulator
MPRQVDHDARRRQIADAVCQLIAERGIEAVTLREVAARAGVSMGAVQRSFPKDGMLLFALEHVISQAEQGGRERIEQSGDGQSAKVLLVTTLQQMALTEDRHGVQARVWLTFAAQAAVEPELAKLLRTHYTKGHDLLIWLIEYGKHTGEIVDTINTTQEARALHAFVDGLTVQAAAGQTTRRSARQLIDHITDRLWTEQHS